MVEVVSLGSINVDRTQYIDDEEIARLQEAYDWFPGPGETVSIDGIPQDLAEQNYENFLGGKAANQAVAAARAGSKAALLGKVGFDAPDYEVREKLRQRGVIVSHVGSSKHPTGKAYIYVDESGESYIAIIAGANGDVNETYILDKISVIKEANVLLLQNEIPRNGVLTLLDRLKEESNRPKIVFDPAPVENAREIVNHALVDIVSPNATEYQRLKETLVNSDKTIIHRQGPDDVIVTRRDGRESRDFRLSPPQADPVDTTGAGDVFNGYLGADLARGFDLKESVKRAMKAASLSTELAGAQQAIPTSEDVALYD
ncbi:MAG: PfkB family carbohydrate kinase [Halobacteriaceae archaeon]